MVHAAPSKPHFITWDSVLNLKICFDSQFVWLLQTINNSAFTPNVFYNEKKCVYDIEIKHWRQSEMTVCNTAVNLIHSSAICTSAMLLSLPLVGCVCKLLWQYWGSTEPFSGLGQSEGPGAALDHCQAVSGLSRATGQTLAPGCEVLLSLHCVLGWRRYSPPADPFLPQAWLLLARSLYAAGWMAFRWCCRKEQYFENILKLLLTVVCFSKCKQ